MLTTVLFIAMGALIASLYFVFAHRRRTPYLELDLDTLPSLGEEMRTLAGLTGGTVFRGNAVSVFQNGSLFPALERDIGAAKHTVHFETFVWASGTLERCVVDWLSRKASEGLNVRVLIDAMGGISADLEQLDRLRQHGGEVSIYCRPRWWNLRRFNHRTHRKLLIVDGTIGYVFGHGIEDKWLGDAQDKHHWRDTALRIEGPVVQALQAVFVENWIEELKKVPAGEGCFPALEERGDTEAHVVSSASGEALSSVSLLYTIAMACARREIIIQNPYFAPDDGVCELLAIMVERGVHVHLMVPGKNTDSRFVRRASFYLYGHLLRAGVRLYEFEPTLLHQKIVLIDEIWSHVGSTNFDARSLALNEEVGIGVRDADVAKTLKAAFENDLRRSREISLQQWQRRSWYEGALDWLAYQLHDQI